jgi:hypothetical protein
MLKLLATMVLGGFLAATDPAALQSPALARELVKVLSSQQIDAIAAEDPDDPERFVAALFARGQLLVVSKRHTSPAAIHARLGLRQYRDVYLDLQASAAADRGWFLQDMQADGLSAGPDHVPDILYAGRDAPTVFDGDWKTQGSSEQEYEQQLTVADQQYTRLLDVLLRQLHGR